MVILFLNFSCFEQIISFNSDNKSGFINYKITITDDFYRIIEFTDEKAKILQFFKIILDENDIKNLISNETYLKLVEYKKNREKNVTEVYISLYFSDKDKLSFQFKNFIFPVYVVEENKIIKCRVILINNFLGNIEKIKTEYKYFIPKAIDSQTFESQILSKIKNSSDKENILKLYIKSPNNNYIFESKYPNIEKFKNERINEIIFISKLLSEIKFNIKEKEIFNSYASLIKFNFTYKFPKPALLTPQQPSITFSQDRRQIKSEYSLIEILSTDRTIENEFSYLRD